MAAQKRIDRLVNISKHLGESSTVGERASAALLLTTLMRQDGHDWETVLRRLYRCHSPEEAAQPIPDEVKAKPKPRKQPKTKVNRTLVDNGVHVDDAMRWIEINLNCLNGWYRGFCSSIIRQQKRTPGLTATQWMYVHDVLEAIGFREDA